MKFPCKSCGACCRALPQGLELNRGDGVCRHYDEPTRLCAVYEHRPLLCRVDELYATRVRGILDARVYYLVQAASCAYLDPGNADMPALTEAALRAAGLGDAPSQVDNSRAASMLELIVGAMQPGDFSVPRSAPRETDES